MSIQQTNVEWLADYEANCPTRQRNVDDKKSELKIHIDEGRAPAPPGVFLARCVHVNPSWTFLTNRKLALYFVIEDHSQESANGTEARKFYNLKTEENGAIYVGRKSNLAKDLRRLFQNEDHRDGIDPVEAFKDKTWRITVESKQAKDGAINAIVTRLDIPD